MLIINQKRNEQLLDMRISPIVCQYQVSVRYRQIAMFLLESAEEGMDDLTKQKREEREKLPSKYCGKIFVLKFDFRLHVHRFCMG